MLNIQPIKKRDITDGRGVIGGQAEYHDVESSRQNGERVRLFAHLVAASTYTPSKPSAPSIWVSI